MALFNVPAAIEALDDLLDHERALIKTGKIDALLRLSPQKERLLARLPGSIDDATTLARLRTKVERNQELLVSAARGIKAATARIDAMRQGRESLRTYGRDGSSADLGQKPGGFNKRA